MTIVELREKRAKLWATMEGFLDTHRDRKGVLSAEDDAAYTRMEQEITDREAAIQDRFEKLRLRVRSIAQTGNLSALQMLLNTEEYADYFEPES